MEMHEGINVIGLKMALCEMNYEKLCVDHSVHYQDASY